MKRKLHNSILLPTSVLSLCYFCCIQHIAACYIAYDGCNILLVASAMSVIIGSFQIRPVDLLVIDTLSNDYEEHLV